MRSLPRQASATLASAVLVAAGLVVGCTPSDRYIPPDPPEVTVSVPFRGPVTTYRIYTGVSKAEETVELRARVKGFLKNQNFVEKEPVKKDQLLFVIDEEPFKVALEMAQAKLAEAQAAVTKAEESKSREVAAATLSLDQATLSLARIEERRSKTLYDKNAGTKESLDQAEASRKKAEAQVAADQASLDQANADYETNILSAKASALAAKSDVDNARINLGYCRITAPFDGWITRRAFDVGNLVGDGTSTVLATIYKLDPIYAYMNVSEADLLMFRKMARNGQRKNFEKGDVIDLELAMSDETGFPHKGVLDYANPTVDSQNATVEVRGRFDNPDRTIYSGLFVKVRVAINQKPDALLVPERALGTDQLSKYLLIVGKDNKVEKRSVKVGAQEGTFRVIEDNLGPDELVVVNGVQKARDGMPVKSKREDAKPPTAPAVAKTP